MTWLAVLPWWARTGMLLLCVAAGAVGGVLWVQSRAYDQGFEASQAAIEAVSAAHLQRVLQLNAELAELAARDAPKIEAAGARRANDVKRTEDAVHASPNYSVMRRPAAVHAERVRQLDAIATSAADH